MAGSLGVELGVTLGARVAQEILKRIAVRLAGRTVPELGAIVGGAANLAFIKAIGRALLALPQDVFAHNLGQGNEPAALPSA